MESSQEHLSKLLQKYLQNNISADEYEELWRLMNEAGRDSLNPELNALWASTETAQIALRDEVWDQKMAGLRTRLNEPAAMRERGSAKIVRFAKARWAAAAVLFLAASSIVYFTRGHKAMPGKTDGKSFVKRDIQPGGNKAILTLSDGRQLTLDSAADGLLASQGNTRIEKQSNGQLVYRAAGTDAGNAGLNTLSVPRGGQYNLVLSDGSRVWLNAASSLTYPAAFTGNQRAVEITGEAYFEIAKDATKPFKVKIRGMEVEVLGTHFNVNAYDDENAIRTTLLEGRVKIKTSAGKSGFLAPGQQGVLDQTGELTLVAHADVEEIVAWKDGNFQFENADIHAVMRQLQRWYDIDVDYQGGIGRHFVGTISRKATLLNVLTMLEQTGEVRFTVNGKKVTVTP